MTFVLHHLGAFVLAAAVVLWLLWRGRAGGWPHACPRTALVLWQVVGLTVVLSVVGTLLGAGLAPFGRGVLPGLGELVAAVRDGRAVEVLGPVRLAAVAAGLALAGWLAGNQAVSLVRTARARSRHRTLLDIVASAEQDALVVDHPAAVAYCVPGRHPRIVVSAGARRLLTDVELAAVLAHERAHARERHDLVLAPFSALAARVRVLERICASIQMLVEMCADDRAARQHGREPLASALERFAASGPGAAPTGALAATDRALAARIHRLRHPARSVTPAGLLGVALLALATSASLFVVPA
ncbi:Zn-dependent protease with chaperone function [Amycolatopsis arida]|uniref:Zn-dependent protease with chaperone function n=1 Tax=Amycolatopsis arida TaxID=587909 RepID=A0A1I5SNF8_9PSEU|nr:M56 family metallopeptidase [Amycolatopsis arida]TDX96427.1 Zn-dependent protease with chaperone function [Amycolatopsis arida]SFP71836.1 Zn-dependent protease with chaperone function [Amycolatopsis arida]